MDKTQKPDNLPKNSGLLAAIQLQPRIGDIEYNLSVIEQTLRALEFKEQNIVVYPEMATTGYFFEDINHLKTFAERVPEGPTTKHLISLAKKFHTYLVVGLPEMDDGLVFNTVAVVGPEGFLAKYRKIHLWSEEKLFFEPGNLGLVLVDLPFCKMGLMICYDLWFPEQIRVLRMMGADVVAVPAALVWNDTPAHVKHGYYMANYVGMAAAHLNQVYLALASQVGHFGEQWLFGSSFIAGPHGWLLEEPAGDQEPAIIQSKVDFTEGKQLRGWGEMDDFDKDRRVDVYGSLLGYGE